MVDQSTVESWVCDLCANEKTLEASLVRLHPTDAVYMLTLECRIPIVCYAPDQGAIPGRTLYTRLQIPTCARANLRKVRLGYMSSALSSCPRSTTPTRRDCDWSRV